MPTMAIKSARRNSLCYLLVAASMLTTPSLWVTAWHVPAITSQGQSFRSPTLVALRSARTPYDATASSKTASKSSLSASTNKTNNKARGGAAASATSLSSTIPLDAAEHEHEMQQHQQDGGPAAWTRDFLDTYWGPRGLLLVLAAVYATNFPLGALMNDHLPSSAATASRMFVAGLALAPFIPQLRSDLRLPAVLCGLFTAMGYVTQSLALADVDPARVSFLGSATVLWCPLLEGIIEKKPMGLHEAPQTWLAAALCMAGIGVLELSDVSSLEMSMSVGDGLALLQAVGFGTGVFWTSRMLREDSTQALPVTATLIATTAFLSMLWCVADGWMNGTVNPDWFQMTLPGMAMEESMRPVLGAVLWTGLISTSLNFFVELTALGKVPPSEASVLLASEPLFASLFAAAFYGSHLSLSDGVGGILIVAACAVNALVSPDMFQRKQRQQLLPEAIMGEAEEEP